MTQLYYLYSIFCPGGIFVEYSWLRDALSHALQTSLFRAEMIIEAPIDPDHSKLSLAAQTLPRPKTMTVAAKERRDHAWWSPFHNATDKARQFPSLFPPWMLQERQPDGIRKTIPCARSYSSSFVDIGREWYTSKIYPRRAKPSMLKFRNIRKIYCCDNKNK